MWVYRIVNFRHDVENVQISVKLRIINVLRVTKLAKMRYVLSNLQLLRAGF